MFSESGRWETYFDIGKIANIHIESLIDMFFNICQRDGIGHFDWRWKKSCGMRTTDKEEKTVKIKKFSRLLVLGDNKLKQKDERTLIPIQHKRQRKKQNSIQVYMKHRCWIRVKNLLSNELRTKNKTKCKNWMRQTRQQKENIRKWRKRKRRNEILEKNEQIRSLNDIHHNLNLIQWIEIIMVKCILSIQFSRCCCFDAELEANFVESIIIQILENENFENCLRMDRGYIYRRKQNLQKRTKTINNNVAFGIRMVQSLSLVKIFIKNRNYWSLPHAQTFYHICAVFFPRLVGSFSFFGFDLDIDDSILNCCIETSLQNFRIENSITKKMKCQIRFSSIHFQTVFGYMCSIFAFWYDDVSRRIDIFEIIAFCMVLDEGA